MSEKNANFNLNKFIYVGFAGLLVLIVVVIAFAIQQLQGILVTLEEVVDTKMPIIEKAQRLQEGQRELSALLTRALDESDRYVRGAAGTDDTVEQDWKRAIDRIIREKTKPALSTSSEINALKNHLEAMSSASGDGLEMYEIKNFSKKIGDIENSFNSYNRSHSDVLRQIANEDWDTSSTETQLLQSRVKTEEVTLASHITQLLNELETDIKLSTSSTKGQVSSAKNNILLLTLGCVIASMISCVILTRKTGRLQSSIQRQISLKDNLAELTHLIREEDELSKLLDKVLSFIATRVDVQVQTFYLIGRDHHQQNVLTLAASYAYLERKHLSNVFKMGESLVGQCAKEEKPIQVSNVPDDYIEVASGTGAVAPKLILCLPVLYQDRLVGVLEMATLSVIDDHQKLFLSELTSIVGIAINTVTVSNEQRDLLRKTQENEELIKTQNDNLKQQQEELRASNDDLKEKTTELSLSQEELRQQSEELRASNEDLEEKQRAMHQQAAELKKYSGELAAKANELSQASQYKTDFLANMSHELRTPLNSLLILSDSLAKNKKGNLTESQVKDAEFIHSGGKDLLNLINDILDMSKVEAGKLDILVAPVKVRDISFNIERLFKPLASKKGLELIVDIDPDVADKLESDSQRLEQIIKNFMSNAVKFTENGSVTFSIHPLSEREPLPNVHGDRKDIIAFSVTDTGIGIPKEKQRAVFEAFTQQDGSTSRKYGGTGLGLTISRELARLLGGDVGIKSVQGEGSTFTLYLPTTYSGEVNEQVEFLHADIPNSSRDRADNLLMPEATPTTTIRSAPISNLTKTIKRQNIPVDDKPRTSEVMPSEAMAKIDVRNRRRRANETTETWIPDDRRSISVSDRSILVIEDDFVFANTLLNVAKEKDFRVLATNKGREGLLLAMEHQPTAILLDAGLPDIDGREVLEQLKYNLRTRHIPVHMISGRDCRQIALADGAISFQQKPVDVERLNAILDTIENNDPRRMRRVLLLEDDATAQISVQRLLEAPDVEVLTASTTAQGVKILNDTQVDCIILDLGLPDYSGQQLVKMISAHDNANGVPIIIYTGRSINADEHKVLTEFSDSIVIKGVESPERLLDEVSLFLHRVEENLRDDQRDTLAIMHDEDVMLKGRRVLLVDDDVRNIYALSAQLKEIGLDVETAENGEVAVDMINATINDPDKRPYDVILMDIMMPVMNGYEAMEAIRKLREYQDTPILSLTAKAMPGDRQKCIDAGASDYVSKPVNVDRLFSMLRVWLYHGSPSGLDRGVA